MKVAKHNWYTTKGRVREQINFYKLFVEKKGIPLEKLIEVLDEFTKIHNEKSCNKRFKMGGGKMLSYIQEFAFGEFIQLLSQRTEVKFSKKPERDYEDEWMESNLNGDFAYSGVTDDF